MVGEVLRCVVGFVTRLKGSPIQLEPTGGVQWLATQPKFVNGPLVSNGIVLPDSTKVHHAFRLTDSESSRTLAGTLEIHTLELGRYDLLASDLANASLLQLW